MIGEFKAVVAIEDGENLVVDWHTHQQNKRQ